MRLASNDSIPGLAPLNSHELSDVRVEFGAWPSWFNKRIPESVCPWYTNGVESESGLPMLRVWKHLETGCYRFLYGDGVQFVVDEQGTRVWADWPPSSTFADVLTYFLGPVLGFVLRLRGTDSLHASAVTWHGRAAALVGPAGSGKSTTLVGLARAGCRALTEDVSPLTKMADEFLVQPGYALVRLWPSSVEQLFGSPEALPKLAPPWDKRYLDLREAAYPLQESAAPLRAVYVLGDRRDEPSAPFIEPMTAHAGVIHLVANTYVNYLLTPAMRAREFEMLAGLAARVPLRRVHPHSDPKRLPDLCRLLIEDFENVT
jgi:hypothetical protein